MQKYPIPMVPGPVQVPAEVLNAYQEDYGSGDLEIEFLDLYNKVEADLQTIFETHNKIAIMSGEGMLALWAALKSCIVPGDRVLCIGTGVFGYGMGDMASAIRAEVKTIGLPYDQTISDWTEIEKAVEEFHPKMITLVHCETPSGTLNPLSELARIKKQYQIPLTYVDVVASLGGSPVQVDDWGIDLALGGTQKCLSVPPGLSFVSISQDAWKIIENVNYVGYDALLPFRDAQENFYFPYTPYWHGLAALHAGTQRLLREGLSNSFSRHSIVSQYCREQIVEIGLSLYPAPGAVSSPTVTAVKVPEKFTWKALDAAFRQRGLVVGGSYGPLSGKVFRLGHMGTQAEISLIQQAVQVITEVVQSPM